MFLLVLAESSQFGGQSPRFLGTHMRIGGNNRRVGGYPSQFGGINSKLADIIEKSHGIQNSIPWDLFNNFYLNTLKYRASGWANTIADTDASGSIIQPSVN
jgi:hypothetical protein